MRITPLTINVTGPFALICLLSGAMTVSSFSFVLYIYPSSITLLDALTVLTVQCVDLAEFMQGLYKIKRALSDC